MTEEDKGSLEGNYKEERIQIWIALNLPFKACGLNLLICEMELPSTHGQKAYKGSYAH